MPDPSAKAAILIVDDDEGMRETLADYLSSEGYAPCEASDVASARRALAGTPIDLILLDLNLGSGDGLALAAEIRARAMTPIIIISGKGGTIDRVVGLEVGADDYLPKPFELRELLARIRALLRRAAAATAPVAATLAAASPSDARGATGEGHRTARFAGLVLDLDRRRLSAANDAAVDLTGAEFALLAMFVARPNRVLSRDQIADLTTRDDHDAFDRAIDTQISRLRRKLQPYCDAVSLIQTVRGEGYVFAAPVDWG